MPVVIMPDGQHVQMPDEPPADMAAPGVIDKVLPYVKDVGRGTLKTLGNMADFGLNLAGIKGQPNEPTMTKRVDNVIAPTELPSDSTTRKIVRGGLEGAGGAMLAPGSAVKNAVIGATAGVGGEVGERAGGTTGRVLGTLAGGGVAGAGLSLARSGSAQTQALARASLEDLPPGALEKAQAFQAEAATRGVKLDLVQALEGTGQPALVLQKVRDVLAGDMAGKKVQRTLGGQRDQMDVAGDVAVAGIPGAVREEGVAANNLAQAATRTVDAAKRERANAVRGLYDKAGDLPPEVRSQFADALNDLITRPGATEAAVAAGTRALEKLRAAPSTQTKMTNALDYDTLIGELTGPYKGTPLSPPDPKTLGMLKNSAGKLNTILQDASPPLKAAEARYAQLSQDVVDPLKQGPVGQLATPRGYRPDTQASVAKMNSLFSKGTDPQASTSALRTAGKEINRVDPGAFADAAKTYVSGNKEAIFEAIAGTGPTSRKQWQGLKDIATVVADGMNVPPGEVVRGLEAFAQMTKATLNRPSSVGGATAAEIASLGGNTLAGGAMRMVGVAPLKPFATRLENTVLGNTYARFDELLTSPEGVQMLVKLGKTPIMSPAAQTLLATFGAGLATQDTP